MDHHERNWYIEYDYKVFTILNDPRFSTLIFEVAEMFKDIEGPIQYDYDQTKQTQVQTWVTLIAQSIREIITLMYNFFNVEHKLSKNQSVKARFKTIYSVLKVQSEYCKYFFTMSMQFRINRIIACCLRFKKFMACIIVYLKQLKKNMDKTLLDNLNQVYLFMKQRIIQTLQVTKQQQDHDLNIIMLDIVLLLLRSAGDPTMKEIIDINKQKEMIDNILKSNEIYDEFMRKKLIQQMKFEEDKYFEIQNPLEEDPTIKRIGADEMHSQQDFD